MAFPPSALRALRLMRAVGPLLYARPVRGSLKQALRLARSGPTEEQRREGFSLILGEASDADGQIVRSRLRTPEGYSFTALATVEIVQRILSSDFRPGFQTPSSTYGPDFVLGFPGVERIDL